MNDSFLRLSTRLQRTDRIIPTYHPYARPSSRTPSPPPPRCVTAPSHTTQLSAMVLRPRPVPGPLNAVPFPKTLRRSVSTLSNPVSSAIDGSIGPPSRLRRADSFSCPAPTTLKRAPSFGNVSGTNSQLNSSVTSRLPEKLPQDPDTDEEEKVRQTNVKRPRTRSNTSSRSGTPEKKKKAAEGTHHPVQDASSSLSPSRVLRSRTTKPSSSAGPETRPSKHVPSPQKNSTATKPTVSSAAKQRVKVKAATSPRVSTRATRPRVETIFGPELPTQRGTQTSSPVANVDVSSLDPSKRTVLPSAPSPTRTLRRVKTTLFNVGIGRKISFGSLPVPSDNTKEKYDAPPDTGVGSGLGSAFELSSL